MSSHQVQYGNGSGVLVIQCSKSVTIVAHHTDVHKFADTIKSRKKDEAPKLMQPLTPRPNPGTLQTWVHRECEFRRKRNPDLNVDQEYVLQISE
jgi:hypothetical protein